MPERNTDILGRGWKYPFEFSREGVVSQVESLEKVRSSLYLLFDTPVGERFMKPYWGSRLKELVFELDNDIFEALAEQYIIDAVREFEPRVKAIHGIEFRRDPANPHYIGINVIYETIDSQIDRNFVYPFFREGAV